MTTIDNDKLRHEYLNFVFAMAEQFGLPLSVHPLLSSDEAEQVHKGLMALSTRVGDTVTQIEPSGDNYEVIKKRFTQDLAFLQKHCGFNEVVKVMRTMTGSVAKEALDAMLTEKQTTHSQVVDLCQKNQSLMNQVTGLQEQLASRLDGSLLSRPSTKAIVACDDMSGDDL